MGEYGGAINNGPAGQVGGGNTVAVGNGGQAAQQPDVFSSVTNGLGDLIDQVAALPTEVLLVGIVAFFVGVVILRRAF